MSYHFNYFLKVGNGNILKLLKNSITSFHLCSFQNSVGFCHIQIRTEDLKLGGYLKNVNSAVWGFCLVRVNGSATIMYAKIFITYTLLANVFRTDVFH